MMPQSAYEFEYLIALGSNLGDRQSYLNQAIAAIGSSLGEVTSVAGFYETAPIGAADQQFINSALKLHSHQAPPDLLKALLAIEVDLGRAREIHWGNRTIDLDIIMALHRGEPFVCSTPSLTIPHPHFLARDFVLCPCAAIAPEWTHPASLMTLAAECAQRGFRLTPRN